MDNIENALNSLKDLFTTKLDALSGSVKSLEAKMDTFEENRSKDHDELIRVQGKIENLVENIKDHERRDQEYGITQNSRIDKIEENVKHLQLKIASWAGAITVAIYVLEKVFKV